MSGKPTTVLCTAVLLALVAAAAHANGPPTTCPPVKIGEELRAVPELVAKGGEVSTTFRIEKRAQCVPVFDPNTKTWSAQSMSLRTYVYPDPDKPGDWRWGYPGPTFRLRRASTRETRGDSLAVLLVNNLDPDDGGATCDNACPASTVCPTDTSQLPTGAACANNPTPLCCCWVNLSQVYPDCFHGDNTTNLHFHGSHVSPQSPQDYVLLELRPKPPAGPAPAVAYGTHGPHGRGVVAYGEFQYRLDPLPFNQSEGTHWYHPHKHGSVSLQVANGMPGAIVIEGPFDDWLRGYYGGKLVEKLLVLQQIQETTNLFNPNEPPPGLLANGQISPTVTMRPGEVQRWRFVNATMQVAAQVSIFFPAGTTVKQIAMDGVRFAPENYGRQPLFDPASPTGFTISPGNRADFLIQAPAQAGSYPVTHRNAGRPAERTQRKLEARDESLAPGPPLAPLVTLVVAEAKEGAAPAATGFPTQAQWPPMPEFLQDIKPEEVVGTQELMFSMQEKSGLPGLPGDPATMFFINGIQYDEHCVNVTTKLGTALDWTVSNSSLLNHPFHIHINPFQVLRNGGTTYTAPYVWQDTIALPAPAKIGDPPQSVLFRHRYLDFTGEYVLHCHFLGHEDRGMMFGVQTVCKDDPAKFGKPTLDEAPECVPYNLIPASAVCGTPPPAAATAAPGH